MRPFAPVILAVLSLAVLSLPSSARAQSTDENGRNCDRSDDPDIAIASCTAQIQSGQETTGNLAIEYSNRGGAYQKKKQDDLALADLNQAIRLDPNLATAFNNRGTVDSDKGQLDTALADYSQAIRLDPNLEKAFYNRGCVYNDKGQYDAAIADFDQAIRLKPNFSDAFNNRGAAHDAKGEKDIAIWQQSVQGQAVITTLQLIRDDAESIGTAPGDHGPVLQYSIGGTKVSDSGVVIADLVSSPAYLHTLAVALAGNICVSPPVAAFFESLGQSGAGTK
ncbi:MAG: tetratricopeptide repeat protein [Terracidiphilus sp.]